TTSRVYRPGGRLPNSDWPADDALPTPTLGPENAYKLTRRLPSNGEPSGERTLTTRDPVLCIMFGAEGVGAEGRCCPITRGAATTNKTAEMSEKPAAKRR